MFSRPIPKTNYCNRHGIEYSGYRCPECIQDDTNKEKARKCPTCSKPTLLKLGISKYCSNPECKDYMIYKVIQ
jgi:hypothetical protein